MDRTWITKLMSGEGSNHSNLRKHILAIHESNPGFTENCGHNFKNKSEKSSYQWLAQIIEPKKHKKILDLACGSGPLLEICDDLYGQDISLIGVDMSSPELKLASRRLKNTKISLINSTAQDLNFISDKDIDVVLCHWALTLMSPVEPVLREIKRVLKNRGIFGAIIDGNNSLSPQYEKVHSIIYSWAKKQYSNYGSVELGDTRIREPKKLITLIKEIFIDVYVEIEHDILELKAEPEKLAKEVSGFFYAALILNKTNKKNMLLELQKFFISQKTNRRVLSFQMPINRLIVTKK